MAAEGCPRWRRRGAACRAALARAIRSTMAARACVRCRRHLQVNRGNHMSELQLFDPSLLAHVDEQKAHNAGLMKALEAMAGVDGNSPEGIAWTRKAMEPGGLFGMKSYDFPEVREIPGPAGPIPIRVL